MVWVRVGQVFLSGVLKWVEPFLVLELSLFGEYTVNDIN